MEIIKEEAWHASTVYLDPMIDLNILVRRVKMQTDVTPHLVHLFHGNSVPAQ